MRTKFERLNTPLILTLIVRSWNELHVLTLWSRVHHHLSVVLRLHRVSVQLLNLIHPLWLHLHWLLLLLIHHSWTTAMAAVHVALAGRHLPRSLDHRYQSLLLQGYLLLGGLRIHFIDGNVLVSALVDVATLVDIKIRLEICVIHASIDAHAHCTRVCHCILICCALPNKCIYLQLIDLFIIN